VVRQKRNVNSLWSGYDPQAEMRPSDVFVALMSGSTLNLFSSCNGNSYRMMAKNWGHFNTNFRISRRKGASQKMNGLRGTKSADFQFSH